MRTVTLIIVHCSANKAGSALRKLLEQLHREYPKALIVGHRDLNPRKACPCFDAVGEYSELGHK